jgi:hypothetical protein
MELVLAALPVETTGALLRTGAMAEIAAILFVRAVMPELAPHYGLLFFFPVTPRWTCTRGFARVGSWKQLSEKHDKTEACFWSRGRVYGVLRVKETRFERRSSCSITTIRLSLALVYK